MLRKYIVQTIETCILCPKLFFFENRAFYRHSDKSLVPPGRKQATGTEDFEFHISYS